MFIMSEVATIIFEETPLAFGKDIRSGRYQRTHTTDPGVIRQVAALGAPSESSAGGSVGVTLLPPSVVLACLVDRRRSELVVPFKTSLIAVASSEAARMLRSGRADDALPVALDVVEQAQDLHRPSPNVHLFEPYLLAARANLAVGRLKQTEDFLALASWLLLRDEAAATLERRARLARAFGKLRSAQGRHEDALRCFAEDAFHCAEAHGPESTHCAADAWRNSRRSSVARSGGGGGGDGESDGRRLVRGGGGVRARRDPPEDHHEETDRDAAGNRTPVRARGLSDWADALESCRCDVREGGDDGAVADADAALAAGLVRALAAKGGEGSMTRAKELVGEAAAACPASETDRRALASRARRRSWGWRDDEGIEGIECDRFGSATRLKSVARSCGVLGAR